MNIQRREIVTAIILSIVTCGIYSIFWMIKMTDEIGALHGTPGQPSGGTAVILTIVTCGIYGIYWAYKMGEKLDQIHAARGLAPASRPILYLVLSIFGLSIVAYALMQDSINKVI